MTSPAAPGRRRPWIVPAGAKLGAVLFGAVLASGVRTAVWADEPVGEIRDDPTGDVTFCDTPDPVPIEMVQLDLVSVAPISVKVRDDGRWDVKFEMRGAASLGREVSAIRDREPLVAVRLSPAPGDPGRVELQAGYRDGRLLRTVVDGEGREIPGSTLAVDEGPAGEAIFSATGLPLGGDAVWGAFTRVSAGSQFACDKLDGALTEAGEPLLPLGGTSATTAPSTTTGGQESLPSPTSAAGDGGGGIWGWLLAALAVGAGVALLEWWRRRTGWRPPCEELEARCAELRQAAEAARQRLADADARWNEARAANEEAQAEWEAAAAAAGAAGRGRRLQELSDRRRQGEMTHEEVEEALLEGNEEAREREREARGRLERANAAHAAARAAYDAAFKALVDANAAAADACREADKCREREGGASPSPDPKTPEPDGDLGPDFGA